MLFIFLTIAAVIVVLIYIRISSREFDHWKKQGVKHEKPLPLIGNMLPAIICSKSLAEIIKYFYDAFPTQRYVGVYEFAKPVLLIRDPELIKSLTIKNFEHFVDHAGFVASGIDPIWEKGLFASQGDRWRDLRQTLSPAFTSSKMRAMFFLMDECAKQLIHFLSTENKGAINVDLKDLFARYANDVIATTAFGIKCDSFKFKNNEVLLSGKRFADFTGLKKFKFMLYGNPVLAKFLNVKLVPDQVANFFRTIIDETVRVREEKKITRPDLIHLMMLSRKGKLKFEEYIKLPKDGFAAVEESETGRNENNPKYLTNEDITAQVLVFFLGAYDTSSSTIAFAGYELAINPIIQKKLRQELARAHKACDGNITYEKLLELKYLDMVISETLRKWPQGSRLDRKCTKAFEIQPERVGEQVVKLKEGDVCWIPVYGLHMDPNYF
ncbi:hypothetical protein Zmor_000807, partial [Zophobas morio]